MANNIVANNAGFPCPRCHTIFPNIENLIEHMYTHIKPYRCANCLYNASRRDGLRRHILRFHQRVGNLAGEEPPADFRARVRVEALGGAVVVLPVVPVAVAVAAPLALPAPLAPPPPPPPPPAPAPPPAYFFPPAPQQ